MRDLNLIFHDGTTFTGTITPNSTTRSGGSAILDVGKSGVDGLWVELSIHAAMTGSGGTVDAKVQYSDSATFASGVEDGPAFPQMSTAGTIWGNAVARRALKCQSKRRYWRVLLTVGATVSATSIELYIASGANRDDAA